MLILSSKYCQLYSISCGGPLLSQRVHRETRVGFTRGLLGLRMPRKLKRYYGCGDLLSAPRVGVTRGLSGLGMPRNLK